MDHGFRGTQTDLESGPLEASYEAYATIKERYDAFLLNNAELMRTYFELVRELAESTNTVREHLRRSSYNRIGPFRRTSSQKRTVDAQSLMEMLEGEFEGLFQTTVTVNKEVLAGYVATGQISTEVVEQATHESENETIRIYGPKPPETILKI
jgi:predicted transcriptional regulator